MSIQVLLGAAFVGGAAPLAWWSVARAGTPSAAAALQRGFETPDVRRASLELSAVDRMLNPAIASIAARAKRITPAGMVTAAERRIAAAGMQGRWTIERVLAAKAMLSFFGLVLGLVELGAHPSTVWVAVTVVATGAGWFVPDAVLDGKGEDRRSSVQRELPDLMDQITIAVEAGLGFEAAVARVCANGTGILHDELARTLQDIQLGVPRIEALEALTTRVDLPDLRHFVTAIRQAERYGLPIAGVLRVQSDELRDKRRQRAEEHAMKIPVKVLIPLVLCILPTLFIVILGPGVMRIMGTFGH